MAKKNGRTKTKSKRQLLEMFHEVRDFCGGLAAVRKGDKWFHVKRDGKPAYPERYDEVSDFDKGVAWVKDETGSFQIRPDGVKVD